MLLCFCAACSGTRYRSRHVIFVRVFYLPVIWREVRIEMELFDLFMHIALGVVMFLGVVTFIGFIFVMVIVVKELIRKERELEDDHTS